MLERSNSAAPVVDLGRFDLRILLAMPLSARPRHNG
jgi:hypothetical protein